MNKTLTHTKKLNGFLEVHECEEINSRDSRIVPMFLELPLVSQTSRGSRRQSLKQSSGLINGELLDTLRVKQPYSKFYRNNNRERGWDIVITATTKRVT